MLRKLLQYIYIYPVNIHPNKELVERVRSRRGTKKQNIPWNIFFCKMNFEKKPALSLHRKYILVDFYPFY